MMNLKLSEDEFLQRTVNQPSIENPKMLRIKPGEPDSSYLVQKIMGAEGIIGQKMPFGREPLSSAQIATIIEWIKQMKAADVANLEAPSPDPVLPFNAWKVVNIPTARMVDRGNYLFLISHRFFPKLDTGYDTFFGLDGSGIIFLNLGYAFTNNLFVNLGRSNAADNVQLDVKYGIKQQYPGDKFPVAAAVQTSINWQSEKRPGLDRMRSEAFKYSFQAILSSQLHENVGLTVSPGILLNQDSETDGEDALITVGVGGRAHVWKSISLIGEWVPIISGYTPTATFGEINRFDTWGGGIELSVGAHAFQIIVTNSAGLTTDQYMRGGGLDLGEGDFRLGFNIFRPLQF
ncbi:MAG: hypothetical protein KDE57_08940 [Calditrichaeota bacterium]|nr:hypothetical protein [Calditrichota bacterium]